MGRQRRGETCLAGKLFKAVRKNCLAYWNVSEMGRQIAGIICFFIFILLEN